MSLNKVMLIGNVGQDPSVRYLDQNSAQGATKVASFTLATTERYRDRNGSRRRTRFPAAQGSAAGLPARTGIRTGRAAARRPGIRRRPG